GGESVPTLLYRGSALPVRATKVTRPDLIPYFGAGSENWGFQLKAFTGEPFLGNGDLVARFSGTHQITLQAQAVDTGTAVRMRESFFQQVTPDATVLEIGSRARSGISRRDRFPAGSKYVGLDIASGPNVDIVGDAHDLSTFIHEPVDFVLSMSTFEHLLMPWKVAIEMSTVMRVGAIAYIESHQAWPLHEEPWDFWRFSANAWQGLFN